jgi:hypothetical protein
VADTKTVKTGRQVARLRAALRDRETRVAELEQRLEALEASTSMQFARVVATAARRPGRGVVRLPRQLYRLWKRRDAPQAAKPGPERRAQPDLAGFDRPEDRMLVAGPVDGLTVAGVFGPAGLAAAESYARVVPLLPHDVAAALSSVDADVVIVDAGAGAPGGPWAYLGEPGVYDREQALATLLDTAHDRGLPVVLWGEAPPPGLARLEWEATDAPGVSLRRFNPVGAGARDSVPVVVEPLGGSSRVSPGVRKVAGDIAEVIGARTATSDHASLPELLRRSAVTLALSPRQVPEQLAAGALVLCPAPVADRLPDDLREHVRIVDASSATQALPDSRRYDPRPALRTLFLRHATPVRMARLCAELGLDADPLRHRRVAVLAEVDGEVDGEAGARRFAADLLAQAHRPAEAVVTGTGAAIAAGELTEHGITVRDGLGSVRSAWVAPWPARDEVPKTHLIDLMCAVECSGADAVGFGAAAPYTFTAEIQPALVRRELYASSESAQDWAAHGARLLCLAPRDNRDNRP